MLTSFRFLDVGIPLSCIFSATKQGSSCALWFLCSVTPGLVGEETGENTLLGIEGFDLKCHVIA
jgi:hypothetical protein